MSLERFIDAQARIWPAPLDEVRAGRKRTHWMWFVFPQLRGLGQSPTAEHFGVADMAEARDYLAHELLGARLKEISSALMPHRSTPARAIFGPVDTLKLRSCMTLFRAVGDTPVFDNVLAAFFDGHACDATLEMIGEG